MYFLELKPKTRFKTKKKKELSKMFIEFFRLKQNTFLSFQGLYTPSSGSASINGLDILSNTIKARRGLGVCPQDNVLYDTLTVEEHLKIYAAVRLNLITNKMHIAIKLYTC